MDSVFYADSKYVISFDWYRTSSNKNRSNTSQKPTKNYPNNNVIAPFSRGQPSEGLSFSFILKLYQTPTYTEKISERYFVILEILLIQWCKRAIFYIIIQQDLTIILIIIQLVS